MRISKLFSALTAVALAYGASSATAATNLALGQPVTGSDYYNVGSEVFQPEKIVDGITTDGGQPSNWSFWLSPNWTNGGQWVQVDLGQNYRIDSVVLFDTHNRWYNDRGTKDFHLSLSTNGTDFSTIGSGSFTDQQWLNQTPVTVTPLSASIGRYVRFNVDSAKGPYGSSGLAEMQVFGSTVPAVPEPEAYTMMAVGLGLLGFIGRRRKQTSS